MITVVGLGIKESDITLSGVEAIRDAEIVVVKTALTPTYNYFLKNGIKTVLLDDFYDNAEDFASLDQKIADYIIKTSENKNLVYAVNGSGVDDGSVVLLKSLADIKIIPGVSYASGALTNSPFTSYLAYSAYDIMSMSVFMPQKRVPLTVKEIDNPFLASELKLKLCAVYGENQPAIIINNGKTKNILLFELDREKNYDYSTMLIIPSVELMTAERYDFADLLEIMAVLLGENGCPWDKSQTHESIRINAIEEAYELVEAIDKRDVDNMCEETGDLLLQSVFHSLLGEAEGEYDMTDTLTVLCKKLIGRHTHIFGANKAANPDEALKSWEAAKGVEKHHITLTEKMESIPKSLPALLYAYKMQKVAVKCGFDWRDIDGTYDKLDEEIKELKEAEGDDIVKEAGDVLFSVINPLRWLKVEPELALKGACEKFLNRFRYMEGEIIKSGEDISKEEIREKYWALAKKIYK